MFKLPAFSKLLGSSEREVPNLDQQSAGRVYESVFWGQHALTAMEMRTLGLGTSSPRASNSFTRATASSLARSTKPRSQLPAASHPAAVHARPRVDQSRPAPA